MSVCRSAELSCSACRTEQCSAMTATFRYTMPTSTPRSTPGSWSLEWSSPLRLLIILPLYLLMSSSMTWIQNQPPSLRWYLVHWARWWAERAAINGQVEEGLVEVGVRAVMACCRRCWWWRCWMGDGISKTQLIPAQHQLPPSASLRSVTSIHVYALPIFQKGEIHRLAVQTHRSA